MLLEYVTKLKSFQEEITQKIKNKEEISAKELRRLKGDFWLYIASKIAPSHLVVTQWCLIDIIEKKDRYHFKIEKILDILAYENISTSPIWAEGYSYWCEVKKVLYLYLESVKNTYIKALIIAIDTNFRVSGYFRNKVLYPAPFGDLKNLPLEGTHFIEVDMVNIGPIDKAKDNYFIASWPIGLNTCIPRDDYWIQIQKGYPGYSYNGDIWYDYPWYSIEEFKYMSKWKWFQDVFCFKRVWSMICLLWNDIFNR